MIPDEAVIAGAAAIQVGLDQNTGLNDLTRAVLEAAAPYMQSSPWEEGYSLGYSDAIWSKGHEPRARNPYYRSQP